MTASGSTPDFQRATRESYDTMAPAYVEFARGELAAKPLERALLSTFAELAAAAWWRPARGRRRLRNGPRDQTSARTGPGARRVRDRYRAADGRRGPGGAPGPALRGGVHARPRTPGRLAGRPARLVLDDPRPGRGTAARLRGVPPRTGPGCARTAGLPGRGRAAAADGGVGHGDLARLPPAAAGEDRRAAAGAGLEVRSVVWRERDTDGPFPERAPQGFVLARRPLVV